MTLEEKKAAEEERLAQSRMTLGAHLDELRTRLFRGVLAIVALFVVAYGLFVDEVMEFAQQPFTQAMERLEPEFIGQSLAILECDPGLASQALERLEPGYAENLAEFSEADFQQAWGKFLADLEADPDRPQWTEFFESGSTIDRPVLRDFKKRVSFIGSFEGFVYQLKICFYAALVLGAPILLWQMWQFVAAGLYEKERRAIMRYFPLSLGAFGIGIAFGFLVIVPQGLYYINQTVSLEFGIPNTSGAAFLSFLSSLCLAFGFIFQLPLVLTFLGSVGLVDYRTLAKYRGEFLIGAFVLAAFMTPPEPFTQVMMGLPMVILYECGILGARLAGRRREAREAAEAAALG